MASAGNEIKTLDDTGTQNHVCLTGMDSDGHVVTQNCVCLTEMDSDGHMVTQNSRMIPGVSCSTWERSSTDTVRTGKARLHHAQSTLFPLQTAHPFPEF